jgi:hypothetical protein
MQLIYHLVPDQRGFDLVAPFCSLVRLRLRRIHSLVFAFGPVHQLRLHLFYRPFPSAA